MKRLVVGSLICCLLAFLFAELSGKASHLDGELKDGRYAAHFDNGSVSSRARDRLDSGLVRNYLSGRTNAPSKRTLFSNARTSGQANRKSSLTADLFKKNCARCHGIEGRGDTELGRTYQTPDLTDPDWWRKNAKLTSTANLVSIVSKGRGGMPAFGKKLKRSEIRLLVNYARRFRNRKP